MTSKIINLVDDQENKLIFEPPAKNLDFSSQPNLGTQHWKIDEILLVKYLT